MSLTDERIIALAKEIFGCCDICLSGRGERDREVTVDEYPIGEDAIAFARAIERELTHGVGATPAPREITPEMMTEAAKRVGFDPVPGKLTRLAGVLNAMLSAGVKTCGGNDGN